MFSLLKDWDHFGPRFIHSIFDQSSWADSVDFSASHGSNVQAEARAAAKVGGEEAAIAFSGT